MQQKDFTIQQRMSFANSLISSRKKMRFHIDSGFRQENIDIIMHQYLLLVQQFCLQVRDLKLNQISETVKFIFEQFLAIFSFAFKTRSSCHSQTKQDSSIRNHDVKLTQEIQIQTKEKELAMALNNQTNVQFKTYMKDIIKQTQLICEKRTWAKNYQINQLQEYLKRRNFKGPSYSGAGQFLQELLKSMRNPHQFIQKSQFKDYRDSNQLFSSTQKQTQIQINKLKNIFTKINLKQATSSKNLQEQKPASSKRQRQKEKQKNYVSKRTLQNKPNQKKKQEDVIKLQKRIKQLEGEIQYLLGQIREIAKVNCLNVDYIGHKLNRFFQGNFSRNFKENTFKIKKKKIQSSQNYFQINIQGQIDDSYENQNYICVGVQVDMQKIGTSSSVHAPHQPKNDVFVIKPKQFQFKSQQFNQKKSQKNIQKTPKQNSKRLQFLLRSTHRPSHQSTADRMQSHLSSYTRYSANASRFSIQYKQKQQLNQTNNQQLYLQCDSQDLSQSLSKDLQKSQKINFKHQNNQIQKKQIPSKFRTNQKGFKVNEMNEMKRLLIEEHTRQLKKIRKLKGNRKQKINSIIQKINNDYTKKLNRLQIQQLQNQLKINKEKMKELLHSRTTHEIQLGKILSQSVDKQTQIEQLKKLNHQACRINNQLQQQNQTLIEKLNSLLQHNLQLDSKLQKVQMILKTTQPFDSFRNKKTIKKPKKKTAPLEANSSVLNQNEAARMHRLTAKSCNINFKIDPASSIQQQRSANNSNFLQVPKQRAGNQITVQNFTKRKQIAKRKTRIRQTFKSQEEIVAEMKNEQKIELAKQCFDQLSVILQMDLTKQKIIDKPQLLKKYIEIHRNQCSLKTQELCPHLLQYIRRIMQAQLQKKNRRSLVPSVQKFQGIDINSIM